jgi:hypothetical protein
MFTIFVESYYSPTTNYVSPAAVFSTITTVNAAVGATTLTRTAGMTATSMFQRNIKMNKDDYPKLVKETGWHKFSTDVTTVASVHGIENVLNPTYAPVPTDPDEVALFHLQKRFFYNVLRSNVETDVGKQIVSDYHDFLDGQQAWEALRVRYQDSHAAKLIAHEKLLKIQQTYYTSSWNGTTEGFVTGFVKLMTEYDTMVPVAQHISEADRISYLHQAVAGETLLGTVRMQCEVHIINGNPPYTFDQIVMLYRTVCANLDRTVKRPRSTTLSANNHNIFDSDD